MNLSESLFDGLSTLGVDYCACVSGGGIMYLLDAVGRNSKINTQFFHHEQSAGIAAEAYSKAKTIPSVCLVTIGPGVANAVSAAFSAFVNSVPVIFISGAKRSNVSTDYRKERFTFPQDADTKSIVSGVTKGFWELTNADQLESILIDAVDLAKSGRPGPVWLSIPLDVQGFNLAGSNGISVKIPTKNTVDVRAKLEKFIKESHRTVVLTGDGVNCILDTIDFQSFIKKIGLPCITSIGSNHTIIEADSLNLGIFGPVGRRAANIALTEADSIIALGTGLDIDLTGFDRKSFFENKKLLSINSDPQLEFSEVKNLTKITADMREIDFFGLSTIQHSQSSWVEVCKELNKLLSVEFEIAHHNNDGCDGVDPYLFAQELGLHLPQMSAVVVGISLDAVSISHSIKLKTTQRLYISKHCGQLGWELPACVGIAHSKICNRVVCVTGDGSFMFNLQDLTTLSRTELPVNIFMYDNAGYNSIRTSQAAHLDSRFFGSTLADLTFPKWSALAESFGFDFFEIDSNDEIDSKIDRSLMSDKSISIIKIHPNRSRTPRLVSKIVDGKFQSPRLSEQFPYLENNMQNLINSLLKKCND